MKKLLFVILMLGAGHAYGTNAISNPSAEQIIMRCYHATSTTTNNSGDYINVGLSSETITALKPSTSTTISGAVTVANFTSTVTITNPVNINGSSVTITNQSINDARFYLKTSSGGWQMITGVTNFTITITDPVMRWGAKYRNGNDTGTYMRIDTDYIGKTAELTSGDYITKQLDSPKAITIYGSNLLVGSTVQIDWDTIK